MLTGPDMRNMLKMITIAKIKKWSKTHPEMLPALLVLPFSSILAALVWLSLKLWYKKKDQIDETKTL